MNSYKGYDALVEYVPSARTFHGSVPNIRGVITFEGNSVEELEHAFHESVDLYLDICTRRGVDPDTPYSGKFIVRASSGVHGQAAEAAVQAGVSLNRWVVDAIEARLDHDKLTSAQTRAGRGKSVAAVKRSGASRRA